MTVAVIGAGFGGLAAALALAARGRRATVLEAAEGPGGKAGEITVDSAAFDTGPSLLTLPEVFDKLLEPLGTRLADHVELRRPDPAFRYSWPDGTALNVFHALPDTLASVRSELGGDAAGELERFLAYAQRIWEAAAPAFVFDHAPTPGRLLRTSPRVLASLLHIDGLSRMGRAIRRRVSSPYLRELLMRFATYNGSDVRRAPATLNCIAHVELGLGGYGVTGGMHALATTLARLAAGAGATFEYGTRVKRITTDRRRVTGVELADGRRVAADAVVANADAAHVFGKLLPGRRRRRTVPSMSAWTAVIRATARINRPAHSVLFPADYEQEFVDIFDHRRVPQMPTVYACAQGAAHGRPGWPDAEPLFVMVNAPAADGVPPDCSAGRTFALEQLRAAGLIDAADPIVWERDPAGLAQQFPGSAGSIYGAASNSPFAAFRRPANRVRGVRGLYLASGSAHPGGGVPLCVQSGMLAADALVRDS